MGVPKTRYHIQINIRMPNPSQEPPASSKAPNEDLKDMDVLCTFKIKIERKNQIMGISKTNDHIQIKIKMPNPSLEPPVSSKAPNKDLKDMDILCTLKIKMEIQNSDHWSVKDQWPYSNQDQDGKPQSGTSSPHQSFKSGFKGHGCSLHLKNQDGAKNRSIGKSKTSDHIQIKIKMPNPSQEPPALTTVHK